MLPFGSAVGRNDFAQKLASVGASHGLRERSLVDRRFDEEQEVDHRYDLVESRDAGLSERRHRREHHRIEVLRVPRHIGSENKRSASFDKRIEAERPNVFGIERRQLLEVEERRRVVHVFEAEVGHDARPRNNLGVAAGGPSECHQVVHHAVGKKALGPVLLDRHFVAPLRELLTLLVDQHRNMRPHRRLDAKRVPQHLLLGRVRKVLFGSHHVADAHGDVVDNVGQQEHW